MNFVWDIPWFLKNCRIVAEQRVRSWDTVTRGPLCCHLRHPAGVPCHSNPSTARTCVWWLSPGWTSPLRPGPSGSWAPPSSVTTTPNSTAATTASASPPPADPGGLGGTGEEPREAAMERTAAPPRLCRLLIVTGAVRTPPAPAAEPLRCFPGASPVPRAEPGAGLGIPAGSGAAPRF